MGSCKERLCEIGFEDTVVFDNPSYDDALIGVSQDGRAIYDIDKMVEWLVKMDGMSDNDALEFIEYNSIRACDYIENSPIVMYGVENWEEK